MRRAAGFSLIEMMIVVTIIGILGAIAMPAYTQYTYRTKRTVAKTAMMQITAQQEAWFNDRKTYANTLTKLGINEGSGIAYLQSDGQFKTTNVGSTIYSIELVQYDPTKMAACTVTGTLPVPPTTVTTFAVKATPVNAQAKDPKCQLLCVSSNGDKGATGTSSPDCWVR
jgi:type IV pilus assembly protein PilE